MSTHLFRFKKEERLKSRKTIQALFKVGNSFSNYPVRVVWIEKELLSTAPAQLTVSVPKRAFRKAVHRNRIRRQIKEAYRLNKHQLYEGLQPKNKQLAIMLIYIAKTHLSYAEIEKAVQKALVRLLKKVR